MNYLIKTIAAFLDFNRRAGRRGVAIYFAALVMMVIMTMAMGLSLLSTSQLTNLSEASNSVMAFAAAETGIEWALKNVTIDNYAGLCNSGPTFDVCVNGNLDNGATYYVRASTCGAGGAFLCATSMGKFQGTQRALKIMR